MSREQVLAKVRGALGRTASQPAPPIPPPLILPRHMDEETRTVSFIGRFEALAGVAVRVPDARAAGHWVASLLSGRTAVASNAAYLQQCGLTSLDHVRTGFTDAALLKAACGETNVGITSADYAFAETGTLVMLSSPSEARLISLLPPVHVAVFPKSRILTGLDELLTLLPKPAEQTSSMVLITGPSRTADIEQILVRGVHGPGTIYAVIVES